MTQLRGYTPAMAWAESVRAPAEGYAVLQVLARLAHIEDGYVAVRFAELAFLLLSTERHMRDIVARLVLDGYLDRVGFPGRAGGIRVRVPFDRALNNGVPTGNETPTRLIVGNETENETAGRLISDDAEGNETPTRLISGNETPGRPILAEAAPGNETPGRLNKNETENETPGRLISPHARGGAFEDSSSSSPGKTSLTGNDTQEVDSVVGLSRAPAPAHAGGPPIYRNGVVPKLDGKTPELTPAEKRKLIDEFQPQFEALGGGVGNVTEAYHNWQLSERALTYPLQFPNATSFFVSARRWAAQDLEHFRKAKEARGRAPVAAGPVVPEALQKWDAVGRSYVEDPNDPEGGSFR